MTFIEQFNAWYKQERSKLTFQIDLLHSGKVKPWEKTSTGLFYTTEQNLKTCERKIVELDDLVKYPPWLNNNA